MLYYRQPLPCLEKGNWLLSKDITLKTKAPGHSDLWKVEAWIALHNILQPLQSKEFYSVVPEKKNKLPISGDSS